MSTTHTLSLFSLGFCGLLAGGCCTAPKPAPSSFGSLPAKDVVAAVTETVLGPEVTKALDDANLRITQVKIVLQLEDSVAGDAKVAVLVTGEGKITRTTAKTLTLQFGVPPEAKVSRDSAFRALGFAAEALPRFEATGLIDAIKGAVDGSKGGKDLIEKLKLTDQEFDYEVDFTISRSGSVGFDIKVGPVGASASSTWAQKTGDAVVIKISKKKV